MAEYQVTFARSARRELEALAAPLIRRILTKIEALEINPRPPGCRKLMGEKDLWRIRVGDYRVIYHVLDKDHAVDIVAVRNRREAYE